MAWNERTDESIARQSLLTVDKSRCWFKFCAAEKLVHRGDVCICTCCTEKSGAKQRNHFEKARTCFGERMSRRHVTALPRTSSGHCLEDEEKCVAFLLSLHAATGGTEKCATRSPPERQCVATSCWNRRRTLRSRESVREAKLVRACPPHRREIISTTRSTGN